MRTDPTDLRLFVAVLESGTITAGAQRLHLSLAAASERLQGLEHTLGVRLLERSKRGVRPTDAGEALARQARSVLLQLERLHSEMAGYARGRRARIRLLCNTAALTGFLPDVLAAFLVAHPELDVELEEMWSYEILQSLRQRRADVGIVADTVDTTGLDCTELREDQLVLIGARQGWPFGDGPVAFAEALAHPFIGLSADSALTRFLEDQADRSGLAVHYRVRLRSFDAVAQMVARGVALAVMPDSAVPAALTGGHLMVRPLADAWAQRKLLLCTADPASLPTTAKQLVQALCHGGSSTGCARDES